MIYLLQHFVLYRDGDHDSRNDSYNLLEEQSSEEVEVEAQIIQFRIVEQEQETAFDIDCNITDSFKRHAISNAM